MLGGLGMLIFCRHRRKRGRVLERPIGSGRARQARGARRGRCICRYSSGLVALEGRSKYLGSARYEAETSTSGR
jgi:hypothetical protein